VGCCVCQYNPSANQYPAEGSGSGPIQKQIVFATVETPAPLPVANIVIGVISSPNHLIQRNAVRSSWVQLQSITDPKLYTLSFDEKQKIVIRFVIGMTNDDGLEGEIAGEVTKYNDIIRVPVVENYFNLTLKTGEFFKWAVASYNFTWIFKCDDDSFVRIDKLLETLTIAGSTQVYLGKMWNGTPIDSRVDRFTPWGEYAMFAAGAGYALSYDLVSYIVRNYEALHKWPMEDVAVGMWLSDIVVNYYDNPHFHSLPEGCDKEMIVQNPASPSVMRQTFFNSMNGVPCHTTPDPFDPSTKNVPDHVLLELGIPKDAPKPVKQRNNNNNMMKSFQPQILIQEGESGIVDNDEMNIESNREILFSSEEMIGMSSNTMNGNSPTEKSLNEMNNNNANPIVYEDKMNI